MITKHLENQLNKSHLDSEQVSILRIQNASLENQIDKLREELHETKKFHTPVSDCNGQPSNRKFLLSCTK